MMSPRPIVDLHMAALAGDEPMIQELVRYIVAHPKNCPQYELDEALASAATHGHTQCVKLLCAVANPKNEHSKALRKAAQGGHIECVAVLLPHSDPTAINSVALSLAAGGGHLACVKMLLPLCDPKADGSRALVDAAAHGHLDCVLCLLPHCDARANNSAALKWAALCGRQTCADALWAHSDIPAVLHDLHHAHQADMPKWIFAQKWWDAHQEHHVLSMLINDASVAPAQSTETTGLHTETTNPADAHLSKRPQSQRKI